jgi:DNA polymerase (family 10)
LPRLRSEAVHQHFYSAELRGSAYAIDLIHHRERAMTKEEVALVLDEIASLLELKGESVFRCNAYRNASRALVQMEGDLAQAVADGSINQVDGIGESTREKIATLVKTGRLPYHEELKASFPPGLFQMLKIPGLGPKKVKALFDAGMTTLDQLQAGCVAGSVASMKGFGAKTQQKILDGIVTVHEFGQRVRIDQALPLGLALLDQLKQLPGVIRAELCGSLRRRRETAKDIDILISSTNAAPLMTAFVQLPQVKQIIAHGETKSSVIVSQIYGGEKVTLNADLRVVSDAAFPYALLYFTGSKEHNVALRERAIKLGLKLNEYELAGPGKSVTCATEADIYAALGVTYIPPELREATGELLAAEKKQLPTLVEYGQLRGVFHNHTTYSDGKHTLREMALAARALGWEYLGIGDHSQSLTVANGLSPERVIQQQQEIDALNAELTGIRILKGIECDILADGRLDYDDEFLKRFDYVVASVHSFFNMTTEEMTARIIRALEHPATTMLGHATGRLLLRRDGYKVDLDAVLAAAAKHKKMIEINAQPMRLDIDWIYVKKAKALGIPLVINPDAHSTDELELTLFGINVARRGWLEAKDVFNTRGLADVRAYLQC